MSGRAETNFLGGKSPCVNDEAPDLRADVVFPSPHLRRLLLGITGSVGAALMPNAIVRLRRQFRLISIDVVLSHTALTLVSARALAALSGGRVVVDGPSQELSPEPLHITMTGSADVFLIMPATANSLGKAANGIADDLISSCILAATCPIIFCPAMNPAMWAKPAVQRNIEIIKSDGHHVVDPVEGFCVSTGSTEIGGTPSIEVVVERMVSIVEASLGQTRRETK